MASSSSTMGTDAAFLDTLWNAPTGEATSSRSKERADLPSAARRYLEHSIPSAPGRAAAVRLKMHGELKLGRWLPFKAEQVIHWNRGMIWRATVRLLGMPIRGADRLVGGQGVMRWKLLGLIPLMRASGPDVTRSTAGRMAGESIWLPSVLQRREIRWKGIEPLRAQVSFRVQGEPTKLRLGWFFGSERFDAEGEFFRVCVDRASFR